ncbi:MAG: ECF transporter S component [Ruminococcaceae bacterium]|nr:ECF transporter S component [Oscillospiraceae bacterium]
MTKGKKIDTYTLVLASLLTAIVIVLQFMGASIRFGMFSISLVLIPIVIGAAKCGVLVGGWLGFVFGLVVLLSGDAAPFMAISVVGTIITVIVKGVACGLATALAYKGVYRYMQYRSRKKIEFFTKEGIICANCKDGMYDYISRNSAYVATLVAAIVCPVVNTGVFLLGCLTFFFEAIIPQDVGAWGVIKFMIFTLVGGNFLFELGTNIVLNPVIVRLLNIVKKNK